ncbi:MAG TPA: hypothetical protein VFP22_07720, partial [Candidatus Limnocylindrales bacterium]|nr:hypothetical protein [Candidatus Limnocylindrales bacterium]
MRAAETDDPEVGDATTEDGPADDRAAEGGALDAGAIAGARPRGPLGTVIRNRAVRRLEIAWTMGIAGDAAFTVAILVAAFELGGAVAVGILSVVRMAPSILAAPFAAIVAGRRRATELLFVTHAVRALGAAVVTVTIIGNLPPVVGLVAAAVAATVGSFVRPFQVAALPSFAAGPDELVAANSVTSTGEGVGSFTGPLIGGFLIATGGPAPAAAAATLLFAAAAASLARLQPSADERAAHAAAEQGRASSGPGVSVGRVGRELAFGVKVAARRPAARVILMGFATQVFVRGLMTTLIVVVAI